MNKYIISAAAGVLLAFFFSLYSHEEGLARLKFHLGVHDREKGKKDIADTLKLFNQHFATFFNTGGLLEGLNEFPAANMVKRRIFQEINEWTKNGQVLVYDKDKFEIEGVDFPDPFRAVAVTKELWFLSVQDRETRKSVSPVKAQAVRVRYMMKKIEGSWLVIEFEVFAEDETIPPLGLERF